MTKTGEMMADEIERIVKEKMKFEGEVVYLKGKIEDLENQLKWKERDVEKLKEKISKIADIVGERRVRFFKSRKWL